MRFVLLLALLALSSPVQAHQVITRMSDGQNVSFTQLIAEAGNSDLVLIGESHDNRVHHEMQLAVIKGLWASKVPIAIGLEMFQTDSQSRLDDWSEGKMDEASFRELFTSNWSDWELYRDILIFARDHHIPMVALNVPRVLVSKVAHYGFASLTSDEKRDLPQGAACDLNNPHTAFLRRTFEGVHSHMAGSRMFTNFCEAQTLRNSGMALNAVRYLKKHPGQKLVGLTGIWHAVRSAIPEQLERSGSKLDCLVIIPEIPELPAGSITASDADYQVSL